MDLKHVEVDMKIAFGDKRFKLRSTSDKDKIIDKLDDILEKITKLNDALGNLEYLRSYYSNIFANNKGNYADYNFDCDDLQFVIEDQQDDFIFMFNDFIECLFNNEDLRELVKSDIPNTIMVVNKISELKDKYPKKGELVRWFYRWLTYISFEEDTFDRVYLFMDKEIMNFYHEFLKED